VSAAFFFGVLGPLSVLQDGESVSVGGPKERAVLATLLARANHLVTVDMLVEAVWGDHPPRSAERTLQAYVARIRGVLEPERSPGTGSTILVKEGSGYRLRLETEQLDSLRFEELARRGSQQLQDGDGAAALTLREALALWRGDAMAEFRAAEACDVDVLVPRDPVLPLDVQRDPLREVGQAIAEAGVHRVLEMGVGVDEPGDDRCAWVALVGRAELRERADRLDPLAVDHDGAVCDRRAVDREHPVGREDAAQRSQRSTRAVSASEQAAAPRRCESDRRR